MYTQLFHTIYPTRIVKNSKPSIIDNIFSNDINREIISGNLVDQISDHMPNFVILQDFKKSELIIKYQKRDYSKFNENNFKMDLMDEHLAIETENSTNVNYVYKIFDELLKNTIEKHAPTKYQSKNESMAGKGYSQIYKNQNKILLSENIVDLGHNFTQYLPQPNANAIVFFWLLLRRMK